jgi:hypothetical protein
MEYGGHARFGRLAREALVTSASAPVSETIAALTLSAAGLVLVSRRGNDGSGREI